MIDLGTDPRSKMVSPGTAALAADAEPDTSSKRSLVGAVQPAAGLPEAERSAGVPAAAPAVFAVPSSDPPASGAVLEAVVPSGKAPSPEGGVLLLAAQPQATLFVEPIAGAGSATKTPSSPLPPDSVPTLSTGLTGADPSAVLRAVEPPVRPSPKTLEAPLWTRIRAMLRRFQDGWGAAHGGDAAVALLPEGVAVWHIASPIAADEVSLPWAGVIG